MKFLELSDAVSLSENKMETFTPPVVVTGQVNKSGIIIEFFNKNLENGLITCSVDEQKSHLFITKENRLPFGDSRKMLLEEGMDFLFNLADAKSDKISEYGFIPDISDDDNGVKYLLKNYFFDSYSESPLRELMTKDNLQMKLGIYVPFDKKLPNVDSIVVIEVGNNLVDNPGLVYYYNARAIDSEHVKYIS